MNRILVTGAALAFALALPLAGCSTSETTQGDDAAQAPAVSAPAGTEADSAAEAPVQEAAEVKWNDVATATDAAKGAGFDYFGVLDKVTVDDIEFANPKFSYADGVAQATYETGATALYVRKADGKHTAPLTDRDKTEFAQKWTKSVEGVDVTLYGPEKDKATVFAWNAGTKDYCVTYQGLGGEEVTMAPEVVDVIVRGMNAAETALAPQAGQPAGQQGGAPAESGYISTDAAKDIARSATGIGLPEQMEAELKVGGDAPHYLVTLVSDGQTHTVEIDAVTGDVWSVDAGSADDAGDQGFISEDDAKSIALNTVEVGLPEQMEAELKVGGDAPHYVVTIVSIGHTYTLEIDAVTGDVWSIDDGSSDDAGDQGFISEDDAKSIALNTVDVGLPEQMDVELELGGDAPHYVVTVVSIGQTYTLEIDAVTGDVWSIE